MKAKVINKKAINKKALASATTSPASRVRKPKLIENNIRSNFNPLAVFSQEAKKPLNIYNIKSADSGVVKYLPPVSKE